MKINCSSDSYIIQNIHKFKTRTVMVRKDFRENKLNSVLAYTTNPIGKWVKSILKIFKDNKCIKVLKSKNGTT